LRMVVPGGAWVRRAAGSDGSVRTVSGTATGVDCSAPTVLPRRARASILPRMAEPTLDVLRQWARAAGFEWSDAELGALRTSLTRALESLQRLEQLPLRDVEPTTLYRMP